MGTSAREATFRTSPVYWITFLLPAFILLVGILISLFLTLKPQYLFIPGVLLVVAGWLLFKEISQALTTRVMINSTKIQVETFRDRYELSWNEIKAIQIQRLGFKRGITFLMADGSEQIRGRFLNLDRLLPQIQSHLSLEVQDPLAYKNLPAYQEWQNGLSRTYANPDLSFHLDLGVPQRISAVFILVFCVGYWYTNIRIAGEAIDLWLLGFAGCGAILLADSFRFMDVSKSEITLSTLRGTHSIQWSTLQRIYHEPDTHHYVMQDHTTRIVLPPAILWMGKNKKEALNLVKYKIHSSGIVPRDSLQCFFWRTRSLVKGKKRFAHSWK